MSDLKQSSITFNSKKREIFYSLLPRTFLKFEKREVSPLVPVRKHFRTFFLRIFLDEKNLNSV